MVDSLGVGLVVIDNASDAYDDDEIKRARVRGFIRSIRTKLARPNKAVLLLAHINKDSAKSGKQASAEDYSGSTAWHNSVRSRLSLLPDGASIEIVHAKANLGGLANPIFIDWVDGVPQVRGTSSDGAETTKALIQAQQAIKDDSDKLALLGIIKEFDKRGEHVTASMQGSSTAFHTLKADLPIGMTKDRLNQLLRDLERSGDIYRNTVKTVQRKMKTAFTCVPAIEGGLDQNARMVLNDESAHIPKPNRQKRVKNG